MGDLKTCGLLHKAYSQKEWAFLFPKRSERSRMIPAIASLEDLEVIKGGFCSMFLAVSPYDLRFTIGVLRYVYLPEAKLSCRQALCPWLYMAGLKGVASRPKADPSTWGS